MAEDKRKDKKMYSYKRALAQPYWIQKLTDDFSLPYAVKLSTIFYAVLVFGLLYGLLGVFPFIPFGLRTIGSAWLGWRAGVLMSDLTVDGKSLSNFLMDYFFFYFKYGIKGNSIYVNKGMVYKKPKIRKGDKWE